MKHKYTLGGLLSVLNVGKQLMNNVNSADKQTAALNNHYAGVSQNINPYQMLEKGGMLVGSEDNAKYKGKTHSQGGININMQGVPTKYASNKEVEGDEVIVRLGKQNYVFSKAMKI